MWYPATVSVAVASEPVTIEMARRQARTEGDTGHDDELTRLIAMARDYVEKITGTRIGTQTVVVKCDAFADMARLSEAPVQSVTSITYVDSEGATQTLATSVYELRGDGIEAAIVLKPNQSWPAIQTGSRITLTAVVGYASPPPSVTHAMLLWLAAQFGGHEPVETGGLTSFDALLMNDRRNA